MNENSTKGGTTHSSVNNETTVAEFLKHQSIQFENALDQRLKESLLNVEKEHSRCKDALERLTAEIDRKIACEARE